MLVYLTLLENQEDCSRFEQLYRKYKDIMHYVANGILNDAYLSEDAVHEAFIRIAKNFHKIQEVDCPQTKAFAVIIVRNVALTMISKQMNTVSMEDYMKVNTLTQEGNPEQEYFSKNEVNQIKNAIDELPVTYRDTMYLHIVNEYSISEIAKILQLPKETIKKRIQRGRKYLQKAMESEGVK